jgi:hypothetical protein
MKSPKLASVRDKIARAEHHLRDIDMALKVVLSPETNVQPPTAFEFDRDRKHLIINLTKCQPVDPTLPLIIGDCIHNLRSALDHLVYRLALENGASQVSAKKTFFPIYLKKAEFDRRVENLVKPFISAAAFAEIEKSQPYSAYDIPEESDIWILSQLDIIDKHRLLIIAGQKFAPTSFIVNIPNGEQVHEVIPDPKWKPMEDGVEIIRFDLSKMPNPPNKMNVHIQMVATVQFVDTGLACDGTLVQDALRQCLGIVSAIVRDFGIVFFSE